MTTAEEAKAGVDQAKAALAKAETDYREATKAVFPKWVKPHESHIDRTAGHVSTPGWPQFHVDRGGNVTVLVNDEVEEGRATAAASK